MKDSLYTTIMRILFPPKCIICDELLYFNENAPFCENCKRKVYPVYEKRKWGHNFDSIVSAVYYKSPIADTLVNVKQHENAYKIKHLCALAADAAKNTYHDVSFDLLTVVPSSKEAVRRAGFDRMDIFGRKLSQMLRIKYNPHAIIKTRETKKQHTLSQNERRTAQKNAFLADSNIVSGKHVLLFDDIVTTGSTLDECSSVLKRAGAKSVCCLTVAATKYRPHDSSFESTL